MKYLDRTLPTPAENLALEEVLLDGCADGGDEVLRIWEPTTRCVVVGYGNSVGSEVHGDACVREGVPILRRASGGGTVVQMPGCLCYAVVLRKDRARELEGIRETNRFVLARIRAALQRLTPRPIHEAGDTDLAIGGRKFAGNAQRRKGRAVLFHGSLLLRADLAAISRWLPMPSHAPAYRGHRPHEDFLVNLGLEPAGVKQALRREWQAGDDGPAWSEERLSELVRARYDNPAWIFRQ